MAQRRHHYERAFEHYLRSAKVPYVAVDEARKALVPGGTLRADPILPGGGALKSFDFVVYGEGTNLLIEVKGRKVPRRKGGGDGAAGRGRLECWVAREDVESLAVWRRLFGSDFEPLFVFIYWCDDQPPDGLFQEVFAFGGRWYAVRAIGLDDYARALRTRSAKWGTVDLAARDFERLSRPFAPDARGWRAEPAGDAGPREPALSPLAGV